MSEKKSEYKQITNETFNEIADDYAKRDSEVVDETFQVKKALDTFIQRLPADARVLDIGSGGGRDSRYLAEHTFKVTGIDASERMIKNASTAAPQIDYKQMDFEALDFPKESFDGIWANASLHHIPKDRIEPVLRKIHELLKEHGTFFMKVKHGSSEGIRENKKFGRMLKRYFAFYSPEELTEIFTAIGFKIKSTEVDDSKEWLDIFAEK